jgi:D-lactate dehydrogenase
VALDVAAVLPSPVVAGTTALGRKVIDPDVLPAWSPDLPRGGSRRTGPSPDRPDAVMFASCTGTMFGPADGGGGAAAAFATLCKRASVALTWPDELPSLCCGTPWKSKGMRRGLEEMTARVLPALWAATREGELPVVVDASSCTEGLRQMLETAAEPYAKIRVVDAVAFTAETVLPRLTVTAPLKSVALHPTCSATRLGLADTLRRVAEAVADSVTVPLTWGCCAFAGDRGLLHPELTASATVRQATELSGGQFDAHASCNRTCELGMTRATGHPYVHVLELVERATR